MIEPRGRFEYARAPAVRSAELQLRAIAKAPVPRRAGALYLFSASLVFVAQTASLSVSPEIVAAREDFFTHGWTRITTDEDGFSLIRVHPCSSVVGSYWLRPRRVALYRRMPSCRTTPWPGRRNTAKALPICNRRYGRLAICATLNRDGALRCEGRRTGVHARWRWNAKHIRKPPEPARWKAT